MPRTGAETGRWSLSIHAALIENFLLVRPFMYAKGHRPTMLRYSSSILLKLMSLQGTGL